VHTARELHAHTIRKCVGFPKRYTIYVGQPIAECASRIHSYVKCANSIYPLNQHEVQLRRDYLLKAYAELNNLVSQIELAAEIFGIARDGDDERGDAMEYWIEIVNRELRLVKGVLKRDRERFRSLP